MAKFSLLTSLIFKGNEDTEVVVGPAYVSTELKRLRKLRALPY